MHWPRLLHGHLLTLYLWCWCLWYLRYQPRLHGYPSFGVPIVQFFAVLLFDNFSRGTWVWGPCPVFLNKWKISPASCCIGTCGKSGTSATVPNIWARQYIAKKNLVEWGSRVLYAIRIQICVCHTQRLISICCMSEHRFNQPVEFHFFCLETLG